MALIGDDNIAWREHTARTTLKAIADIPKENLVYIDESGITKLSYRESGYAKRGEKIIGKISGKRFIGENFIAAQVGKKIIAPGCYRGSCDANTFNTWLRVLSNPSTQTRTSGGYG